MAIKKSEMRAFRKDEIKRLRKKLVNPNDVLKQAYRNEAEERREARKRAGKPKVSTTTYFFGNGT